MQNNLDTKLARIENTISLMKTNLQLSENEVIEKVAEATNLHTLANIFIQEEEPEIKEGIWIQADSETHPYDTIKIDKDIIIPGAWRFDTQKTLTLNGSNLRYNGDDWRYNFCIHDNKLYFVNKNALYEINKETGAMTKVRSLRNAFGMIYSGGGYLWFAGQGSNTTGIIDGFNLSTNQDITITMGKTVEAMCYSAYDNSLYTYSNGMCRYDLATDTVFTQITTGPAYTGALIPMGSKILCLGSTDRWGLHNGYIDIDNGYAYTSVTNILDKQLLSNYYGIPFVVGNLAYIVNFEYADPIKSIYTINLETLEYTDVTNLFASDMLERTVGLIYDSANNIFYIIDYSSSQYKLIVMENTTKQYENNMIIIMQSPITRSEKQTALWTYPCLDGRMCQSFFDVYYYNKETGIDFSLPMYYGNGTEWIQFK